MKDKSRKKKKGSTLIPIQEVKIRLRSKHQNYSLDYKDEMTYSILASQERFFEFVKLNKRVLLVLFIVLLACLAIVLKI